MTYVDFSELMSELSSQLQYKAERVGVDKRDVAFLSSIMESLSINPPERLAAADKLEKLILGEEEKWRKDLNKEEIDNFFRLVRDYTCYDPHIGGYK